MIMNLRMELFEALIIIVFFNLDIDPPPVSHQAPHVVPVQRPVAAEPVIRVLVDALQEAARQVVRHLGSVHCRVDIVNVVDIVDAASP